jgi:DNA repair exonuclease SbcCD ATPase subunit
MSDTNEDKLDAFWSETVREKDKTIASLRAEVAAQAKENAKLERYREQWQGMYDARIADDHAMNDQREKYEYRIDRLYKEHAAQVASLTQELERCKNPQLCEPDAEMLIAYRKHIATLAQELDGLRAEVAAQAEHTALDADVIRQYQAQVASLTQELDALREMLRTGYYGGKGMEQPIEPYETPEGYRIYVHQLSLRDYFAARAIRFASLDDIDEMPATVAQIAYRFADAMLKERETTSVGVAPEPR